MAGRLLRSYIYEKEGKPPEIVIEDEYEVDKEGESRPRDPG